MLLLICPWLTLITSWFANMMKAKKNESLVSKLKDEPNSQFDPTLWYIEQIALKGIKLDLNVGLVNELFLTQWTLCCIGLLFFEINYHGQKTTGWMVPLRVGHCLVRTEVSWLLTRGRGDAVAGEISAFHLRRRVDWPKTGLRLA